MKPCLGVDCLVGKMVMPFTEGEIRREADLGKESEFHFGHVCSDLAVAHPVRSLPGVWIAEYGAQGSGLGEDKDVGIVNPRGITDYSQST